MTSKRRKKNRKRFKEKGRERERGGKLEWIGIHKMIIIYILMEIVL